MISRATLGTGEARADGCRLCRLSESTQGLTIVSFPDPEMETPRFPYHTLNFPSPRILTPYNYRSYYHYYGVVICQQFLVRHKARYSRPPSRRLSRPFVPLLSPPIAHPRAVARRVVQPVAGRRNISKALQSRILRARKEIRYVIRTIYMVITSPCYFIETAKTDCSIRQDPS